MAKGMGDIAKGLEAVAVPMAEKQAAEDLLKQKVTRNADGSVTVANPASFKPGFWEVYLYRALSCESVPRSGEL
jgi:hypothetical protein